MSFSTVDSLIAAMPGRSYPFSRSNFTTANNSFLYTQGGYGFSTNAGGIASTSNTAGIIPSSTSSGFAFIPQPPSGLPYLARWSVSTNGLGIYLNYTLCDILWYNGGLSWNVTTAQTFTMVGPITRWTSSTYSTNGTWNPLGAYVCVEPWLIVWAAPGSTSPGIISLSYTNQSGVAGQTAQIDTSVYSTPLSQYSCIPFLLAAGDTGVQSVQSVTIGTATGSAGNLGIVLLRRIADFASPTLKGPSVRDYVSLSVPYVAPGATLALLFSANGNGGGAYVGRFDVVSG